MSPLYGVSMHHRMPKIKDWSYIVSNYKDKAYLHFDKRCSLNNNISLRAYVEDPQKVASHSFYPFIHFQMVQRKIEKNDVTKKVKLKDPKLRELYFASHLDRCIYTRYAYLLNERYNDFSSLHGLDNVAIAYRTNTGKCNIDYAINAFEKILSMTECLIFVTDFSSFFDKLDHKYLKKQIKLIWSGGNANGCLPDDLYAVYKNITKYSFFDKDFLEEEVKARDLSVRQLSCYSQAFSIKEIKKHMSVNKAGVGIPQGSPVSAVLSNIYMVEKDQEICKKVSEKGGFYKRYCDDVIIAIPVKSKLQAMTEGEYWIRYFSNLKVAVINAQKTELRYFSKGQIFDLKDNAKSKIDYLGFVFDGRAIKVRDKSIGKYFYRMRKKALQVGRSKGITKLKKQLYPWRLYDLYSTCRKDKRWIGPKKEKRTQRNFISYLNRANKKNYLKFDVKSLKLLKRHKFYVRKFIKEGANR